MEILEILAVACALAVWVTAFVAVLRLFRIDSTLRAIRDELRAARSPAGAAPASSPTAQQIHTRSPDERPGDLRWILVGVLALIVIGAILWGTQ